MRLFHVVPVVVCLFTLVSEVVSVKRFPTATRPPLPPPPPPRVVFLQQRDDQTNRIQSHEMIAPNYVQQVHGPSLSLGNPDFNIPGASGNRPQQPPRPQHQPPQRPQPQRPPTQQQPQRPPTQQQPQRPPPQQQPQRPPTQQQPQRPPTQQPQRPQTQQPFPPQPQRPQIPFSRPVARPPVQLQKPNTYHGDPFYYHYSTDPIMQYPVPYWSQ